MLRSIQRRYILKDACVRISAGNSQLVIPTKCKKITGFPNPPVLSFMFFLFMNALGCMVLAGWLDGTVAGEHRHAALLHVVLYALDFTVTYGCLKM